MYRKLKKIITEHLLVNLLPSILTLQLMNCVIFSFWQSYLPSDSQTNTVIWPLCLPVKMVSRPHLSGRGYWRQSYQIPLRQFYQVLSWNKIVPPGLLSLFAHSIVSEWMWPKRWIGLDHLIVEIRFFLMVNTHWVPGTRTVLIRTFIY